MIFFSLKDLRMRETVSREVPMVCEISSWVIDTETRNPLADGTPDWSHHDKSS